MIGHASGNCSKPIVSGFFLYYIVNQDRKSADYIPPLGDLQAFENEWVEVEIPMPDTLQTHGSEERAVPKFLRENVDTEYGDESIYKQAHLEIDAGLKSDRIEWGHVRYHRKIKPGHTFEIVVQWLTASGPIVYDLVYGWMRKATQCGFQFVSVPADPLAEPFTDKSDPLRGPIFVPLNVHCLEKDGQNLFKGMFARIQYFIL